MLANKSKFINSVNSDKSFGDFMSYNYENEVDSILIDRYKP